MLDIQALGGAGFASQRTLGEDRRPLQWDLSSYNGIEISLDPSQSDHKVYTIVLKDHILPPNPNNGPEQATTSWEYDFSTSACQPEASVELSELKLFVPWDRFKPTYRGKPINNTKYLGLSDIKGISIMIRRFVNQAGQMFVNADIGRVSSARRKDSLA